MTALAAVAGATCMAGLLLVGFGLAGTGTPGWDRAWRRRGWRARRLSGRRLAVLVATPLATLALTGWPVAALLALTAAAGLPTLLGARGAARRRITRLEALADWTRRLGDLLTAGAGLEQALESSLAAAPTPIAVDVGRLVARLRARHPVELALRDFGDDLDDPTGDLVVAALVLAADRRGRGLARLLAALARTVDAEVAMRRGIEADRATPRTTARWVMYITVAVTSALVLFNRDYVAPFGSATGQVTLALIGGLFGASFLWMYRLTEGPSGARFLVSPEAGPRPADRVTSGGGGR